MFYNDPMLYGATLPYRDVNFQTPFMPQYFTPWQNAQRFLPQGYNYGFQDFPKVPYAQTPQFPFLQQFPFQPFAQQFPLQQFPFQPFAQQLPFQQLPFPQFAQQIPLQQFPFQGYLPMQGYTPFTQFGYGFQTPFFGQKTPYTV